MTSLHDNWVNRTCRGKVDCHWWWPPPASLIREWLLHYKEALKERTRTMREHEQVWVARVAFAWGCPWEREEEGVRGREAVLVYLATLGPGSDLARRSDTTGQPKPTWPDPHEVRPFCFRQGCDRLRRLSLSPAQFEGEEIQDGGQNWTRENAILTDAQATLQMPWVSRIVSITQNSSTRKQKDWRMKNQVSDNMSQLKNNKTDIVSKTAAEDELRMWPRIEVSPVAKFTEVYRKRLIIYHSQQKKDMVVKKAVKI